LIVLLDTGGVEGLIPIDARRRARLRALREQASDLVLPAAVLAEGVFTGHVGHDYHVGRLLELVQVADLDQATGLAAGTLRQAAIRSESGSSPSGIDAIVAATANEHARVDDACIVTSDVQDIGLLVSLADHAARISVLGV
jgi:predicted nucleic acid-binding protein